MPRLLTVQTGLTPDQLANSANKEPNPRATGRDTGEAEGDECLDPEAGEARQKVS